MKTLEVSLQVVDQDERLVTDGADVGLPRVLLVERCDVVRQVALGREHFVAEVTFFGLRVTSLKMFLQVFVRGKIFPTFFALLPTAFYQIEVSTVRVVVVGESEVKRLWTKSTLDFLRRLTFVLLVIYPWWKMIITLRTELPIFYNFRFVLQI